jgi:hypothetical protein
MVMGAATATMFASGVVSLSPSEAAAFSSSISRLGPVYLCRAKLNERGGVGSADFGLSRESELGSKVSSGLCCVAIEYFYVDSHRGTSHFTTRLYDLSPVKYQLRMKCKMRLISILRPQSANLRVAPSLSNLVC